MALNSRGGDGTFYRGRFARRTRTRYNNLGKHEGSLTLADTSFLDPEGQPEVIACFSSGGTSQGELSFYEAKGGKRGRKVFDGTTKAFVHYIDRFLRGHYRRKQLAGAMGHVMYDYRMRTGKKLEVGVQDD